MTVYHLWPSGCPAMWGWPAAFCWPASGAAPSSITSSSLSTSTPTTCAPTSTLQEHRQYPLPPSFALHSLVPSPLVLSSIVLSRFYIAPQTCPVCRISHLIKSFSVCSLFLPRSAISTIIISSILCNVCLISPQVLSLLVTSKKKQSPWDTRTHPSKTLAIRPRFLFSFNKNKENSFMTASPPFKRLYGLRRR